MKEIDKILRDQKKFTKVNLKDGTTLNFAVNQEKHVDKDSQETCWVNSMTEKKILKTYRWQYIKQALRIARHFDHSSLQTCEILSANFKTFDN